MSTRKYEDLNNSKHMKVLLVLYLTLKKVRTLKCKDLKKNCFNLENSLKHNDNSDIDGLDLYDELETLREIIQVDDNSPINILNQIKRLDSFPNAHIAYRVMLTILVTVASAKRSFSKLRKKLISKI